MTLTLTTIAETVRANVHPDHLNDLKAHSDCVTYQVQGHHIMALPRDGKVCAMSRMSDEPSGKVALRIDVSTDAYRTWKQFVQDGGTKLADKCVGDAIRRGLVKDLRIVEFYRPSSKTKDIDCFVTRSDRTPLVDDEVLELKIDGIDLSPAGVRH